MPTPVEFVSGSAGTKTHFVCTFKANLSDLPQQLFSSKLSDPPLRGRWAFAVENKDGVVTVGYNHGVLPVGALGRKVSVHLRLEVMSGDKFKDARSERWDPGPAPRRDPESMTPFSGWFLTLDLDKIAERQPWFKPLAKQVQTYRLTMSLRRTPKAERADAASRATRRALLAATSDPDSVRAPKNVCLFFPRDGHLGHRIWTTTAFLEESSPYFKTMLDSGCVEAIPSRSKRQRTEDIKPDIDLTDDGVEKDWDDSDDENDNAVGPADDEESDDDDRDFQRITVREFASSTYRAVLLYLKTGHIVFAPLRSSFREPHTDDQHESRAVFLSNYAEKNPKLPLPASPKSVYRLAHLLQLPDLQDLALDCIITHISTANVTYELFSPVSIAYDEVREAIVDFAAENFAAVKASDAWKEQQEKVDRGEIPGSLIVYRELLSAVFEANAAS